MVERPKAARIKTTSSAPTSDSTTGGNGGGSPINDRTPLVREAIFRVLSEAGTRSSIAAFLGMTYQGNRDLYDVLGYTKAPVFQDFMARYKRQEIAHAVIDAPVRACWRRTPEVTDSKLEETPFKKSWKKVATDKSVYQMFRRVDRLASIGSYAVILMGFDDGGRFEDEVTKASRLLFIAPYSEVNARISEWVTDEKDERFGQPKFYNVNMQRGASTTSRRVHWSRVIHVAEDVLEDSVCGQSRLEPILNRLQDIELVSGSSAEMFWRGAFPGYSFEVDPEATTFGQNDAKLEAEIQAYMHGFQRYLKLEGMNVKALTQLLADPGPTLNVLIDLVCACTRIPKRIFLGSEQGVLASGQDAENWASIIEERRFDHCEANILRPFVDRLVKVGVVAPPVEEYRCEWPDVVPKGAKEEAEIGVLKSSSLKNYTDGNADAVCPPEVFFRECWGFDDDQIKRLDEVLSEEVEAMLKEEEAAKEIKDATPSPPPVVPAVPSATPEQVPVAAVTEEV